MKNVSLTNSHFVPLVAVVVVEAVETKAAANVK